MNLDHNTTSLAGAADGTMDVGLPGLDGAEEDATELRRGMGAGGPDSAELRWDNGGSRGWSNLARASLVAPNAAPNARRIEWGRVAWYRIDPPHHALPSRLSQIEVDDGLNPTRNLCLNDVGPPFAAGFPRSVRRVRSVPCGAEMSSERWKLYWVASGEESV
jgi:hypothetical protein